MKVIDFLPKQDSSINIGKSLDSVLKFSDFLQKSNYDRTKSQGIGIEQLYFDWLRTAYAYRRMFIQDLYLLAFDITEVRTAILHIKNEVLRKGFDEWIPKFNVKCVKCGREFQQEEDHCDKCFETEEVTINLPKDYVNKDTGAVITRQRPVTRKRYVLDESGKKIPSKVRKPDIEQYELFDKFKRDCNIFNQSLEDVFGICMDDLNIIDDAFIYLNKEYVFKNNKLAFSKVAEIRRINPALIEYDFDKDGVPESNHWICLEHRDVVRSSEGACQECGKLTHPAMFIYNHRGKKLYLLSSEVIHISKFNPSECYDEQTEILTENGWKLFKNVDKEELVATLNPETKTIEYQKPTKYFEYDGPEFMYKVSGSVKAKENIFNIVVTPNHKNYVDTGDGYKLHDVKSIYRKKVKYLVAADWVGEEKKTFVLPEVIHDKGSIKYKNHPEKRYEVYPSIEIKMDDWLEFLGYWIAEGEVNKKDVRRYVAVSQISNNPKWDKINECLKRLPFEYRYIDNHKFIIKSWHVKEYLLKTFGTQIKESIFRSSSDHKFIPKEYKFLSKRQLNIFLNALVLGDGHWSEFEKRGAYSSISKRLLDDVQEIALKCGYSARLAKYSKKDPKFTVRATYFDRISEIEVNQKTLCDEFIPYSGKVYCIGVPNRILLVRRLGKPFFSGNSYGYSPLLTIMQKVLTLSGMDRFLYRYFFERKTPSQILLTYTDDPASLEIERARIEAQMKQDPTYTPWIGVSQKTGRGRTDIVKLFHTLQEMDYLPVRNEIRERISAIYGVSPIWMGALEGVGGISGQSVTGDTPLYVRYDKKYFDIIPIACLRGQKVNESKWRSRDLKRVEVWTKSGWSPIFNFYAHENKAPIKVVEAYDGAVKLTGDHSIMCKDEIWKSTNDLKIGDEIFINKCVEGNSIETIAPDFAWALGFWAAEGCANQNLADIGVCCTNKEYLEKWAKSIENHYMAKCDVNYDIDKNGQSCEAKIEGSWIVTDILRMCTIGKDIKEGWNRPRGIYAFKKVPIEVLNGTLEIKEAFLKGYWAGDGAGSILQGGFKTKDSVLAAGLMYLLNQLGIKAKISFNLGVLGKHNDIYRGSVLVNHEKYFKNKEPNEIRKIFDWTKEKELVFDIETQDHTFVTALGGFVLHNTQQLIVMSRVIEKDQRLFNEKIFPKILENFGITDWELKLKSPEEKTEQSRIQFVSNKVSIANMLFNMGFDVKLLPGKGSGVDSIDFEISGEAKRPDPFGGMGGGFGGPETGAPGIGSGNPMGEIPGGQPNPFASGGGEGPFTQSEDGKYALPKDNHVHGDIPPHNKFINHDIDKYKKQESGAFKELEESEDIYD